VLNYTDIIYERFTYIIVVNQITEAQSTVYNINSIKAIHPYHTYITKVLFYSVLAKQPCFSFVYSNPLLKSTSV